MSPQRKLAHSFLNEAVRYLTVSEDWVPLTLDRKIDYLRQAYAHWSQCLRTEQAQTKRQEEVTAF